MEIIKIQKEDLLELSKLHEELSDMKSNLNKIEANFALMISNDYYHLIGAKIDSRLVGSLMGILCLDLVGECRPFMIIENVIVSNQYRNKGIGKALLNEIESIAKHNNCYYIFFVSSNIRKEAHLFYESVGYTNDKVKGFKKYL